MMQITYAINLGLSIEYLEDDNIEKGGEFHLI